MLSRPGIGWAWKGGARGVTWPTPTTSLATVFCELASMASSAVPELWIVGYDLLPARPGVVLRESQEPPLFLERNVGGWFNRLLKKPAPQALISA